MADDPLLEKVARLMAEQDDAVDPELEAYAAGTLSREAEAALLARAEADPRLKEALALYAPLSPAVQGRIADAGLAEVRPRATARSTLWGGLLAMAAAVALGLFALSDRAAPLPAYTVDAMVQDALYRADGGPRATTVRADSTIELRLVPAVPAEGDVAGRLFLLEPGEPRAIAARAEVSPDGAVRWRGTPEGLLGVATGTVSLRLIVGRPGHLPDRPEPRADQRSADVRLVVRPSPPRDEH